MKKSTFRLMVSGALFTGTIVLFAMEEPVGKIPVLPPEVRNYIMQLRREAMRPNNNRVKIKNSLVGSNLAVRGATATAPKGANFHTEWNIYSQTMNFPRKNFEHVNIVPNQFVNIPLEIDKPYIGFRAYVDTEGKISSFLSPINPIFKVQRGAVLRISAKNNDVALLGIFAIERPVRLISASSKPLKIRIQGFFFDHWETWEFSAGKDLLFTAVMNIPFKMITMHSAKPQRLEYLKVFAWNADELNPRDRNRINDKYQFGERSLLDPVEGDASVLIIKDAPGGRVTVEPLQILQKEWK